MRLAPRALVHLPLLALLVLGSAGTAVLHGQTRSVSMTEALDMYEKGDPNILRTLSGIATTAYDGQLKRELAKFAPRWIVAGGPGAIDRRRLVVASFVLDTLAAVRVVGGGDAPDLIKWTTGRLRETKTPLPGERMWHIAAIELLEYSGNPDALENELGRARQRFPDEPRFLLANAWLEEAMRTTPRPSSIVESYWDMETPASVPVYGQSSYNSGTSRFGGAGRRVGATGQGARVVRARGNSLDHAIDYPSPTLFPSKNDDLAGTRNVWTAPDRKARVADSVRAKYTTAAAVAALAPEATLRLGYLDLVSGKPDAAVASFTRVTAISSQREFVYLAYLFRGWSQERLQQFGAAELSYRNALKVIPDARTAATSLAATLQAEGKLDDAQAVVEETLGHPSAAVDPWLRFGQGDLFSVPNLAAALRTSWQ